MIKRFLYIKQSRYNSGSISSSDYRFLLIKGDDGMDILLVKNDLAKVIFLPKNTVIWQYNESKGKLLLDSNVYEQFERVYSSNDVLNITDIEKKCFQVLIDLGLLLEVDESYSIYKDTMYEKTNYYFHDIACTSQSIEILKSKKILVIGLGGVGTEIIKHFMAVGIKKYVLIEFDNVSPTNLNRQYLFNHKDIGKSKLELVKNHILESVLDGEVATYCLQINSENELKNIIDIEAGCDLMFCAADMPPCIIQTVVTNVSISSGVPCMFCGVGITNGQVGPLLCEEEAKRDYINGFQSFVKSNATIYPASGSIGVTNSIISAYAAKESILYLSGNIDQVRALNKHYIIEF